MNDCVFCKIIDGVIPTELLYQDDDMIAFNDISPKSKHHILIVPRKHIPTINDIDEGEGDDALIGRMFLVAKSLAKERELDGYKLMFNVGASAGQVVFHIHLHLMNNG
jgi:histidine triad (HIT) family protein